MSIVDDCVKFLEDLILGDFNDNQQVSAQLVSGLISLIPIVDQVMDVRDVSGTLYRINKHGGFAKATLEHKIDLGFAAFGVIPEVGSAFKTVFKPLYKQRKAMKGVMNGGVAMVERMLGKNKGGAVKWVKALDWAGNTQIAVDQANMALDSCIGLLDFIAQGHWWCPDRREQLARDVSPGLRSLRGKLAAPIREAATHIRAFLEDMLGEHAAAVALAIAGNAGSFRHTTARAPAHTSKDAHAKVSVEPRVNGKKAAGTTVRTVQTIAYEGYKLLDYALKGLMGEHIVEHHVIEKKHWGLEWNRHDMNGGQPGKPPGWQSTPRKVNDDEEPLFLCTPAKQILLPGIDSLWLTNRSQPHKYAVVEAKASMSGESKLINLLGEANDPSRRGKKGKASKSNKSAPPNADTSKKNNATSTKSKYLQMSHKWILDRVRKDFPQIETDITSGLDNKNYSRHVFLVTPIEAAEHIIAVNKILADGLVSKPAEAQKYAKDHHVHKVHREFEEKDIADAEVIYKDQGKPIKNNGKKEK